MPRPGSVYLLVLVGVGLAIVSWPGRVQAASGAVCKDLTVRLSDDKNYYIFTARAAANGATIGGYAFDFGDHQSYKVMFDSRINRDRSQAVANHAYEANGNYTVIVSVLSTVHSKQFSSSSTQCSAGVTIGPRADELVNTGPDVFGIFVGASLVGAGVHYSIQRRFEGFGAKVLGRR